MEVSDISGTDQIVFEFNEKKYRKVRMREFILYISAIILPFLIISIFCKPFLSTFTLTSAIAILSIQPLLFIYDFFEKRNLLFDSSVKIFQGRNPSAYYNTSSKYNEDTYTVFEIDSLKKSKYNITVKGKIVLSRIFNEGSRKPVVLNKKRLRIHAYFENIDGLYEQLKLIKEQTDGDV